MGQGDKTTVILHFLWRGRGLRWSCFFRIFIVKFAFSAARGGGGVGDHREVFSNVDFTFLQGEGKSQCFRIFIANFALFPEGARDCNEVFVQIFVVFHTSFSGREGGGVLRDYVVIGFYGKFCIFFSGGGGVGSFLDFLQWS